MNSLVVTVALVLDVARPSTCDRVSFRFQIEAETARDQLAPHGGDRRVLLAIIIVTLTLSTITVNIIIIIISRLLFIDVISSRLRLRGLRLRRLRLRHRLRFAAGAARAVAAACVRASATILKVLCVRSPGCQGLLFLRLELLSAGLPLLCA